MTADEQLAADIDAILNPRRPKRPTPYPPNLWDELSARGWVITEIFDPKLGMAGTLQAIRPDGQLGTYEFTWTEA